MAKEFKGNDVKAVLALVKALVHDDENGDLQLSILTMALVVGCKSCGVLKEDALAIIEQTFDDEAKLALIPWHQIGANS